MITIAYVLSTALSAAIVPIIIAYAESRRLFDRTDARKIHDGRIPRLGGIGIVTAFVLTIAAFAMLQQRFRDGIEENLRYWPILVGFLGIFFLGLVDDFKNLRARLKFFVQLSIAMLVVISGFRFKVISIPFGDGMLELGPLSWPLTVVWIIGITNAMNLIDGLDGLAGGLSIIAASAFGTYFLALRDSSAAVICFALAGGTTGFLLYNWPKARIFMGDSGSLFIGFTLAVLPLLNLSETLPEIGIVPAATILGLPILDTLAAILRRTKAGVHFFTPDRGHIHHLLKDIGLSDRGVLSIIYPAAILLALASLVTVIVPGPLAFWINLIALLTIAGLYRLLVAQVRDHGGSPLQAGEHRWRKIR